jgi:hypothetical protein
MTGIWMIEVETAKNRSQTFLVLRKNDRQSGKEMTNRRMISISKISVITDSVTSFISQIKHLGRADKMQSRSAHVGAAECLNDEIDDNQRNPNNAGFVV